MFPKRKIDICFAFCTLSVVIVGFGVLMVVIADYNNSISQNPILPLVVTTWYFTNATAKAWEVLYEKKLSSLDAVEAGCTECEVLQCDTTVGYGGSPDEDGETTLDAFIMDGATMNIGAVGALRRIKSAARVARKVLENTEHSILGGELATKFAVSMGFTEESLTTNVSTKMWNDWKSNKCQPNYWTNVEPDPKTNCGPYKPKQSATKSKRSTVKEAARNIDRYNHDTISMIAIDSNSNIAAGMSSNGAKYKIPGRIGDAPIVGAGAYADNTAGAAVCTGDGDVMMRFLPSFLAVEEMRRGATPSQAGEEAIRRILKYYKTFSGAIIVVNTRGEYAAACHGLKSFPFSLCNPTLGHVEVQEVPCITT